MTSLRDIVLFKSGQFTPLLPEECQVNPGVYGAELAFWLCTELARRGVATSYPGAEDWGWYIEFVAESGAEFAVHCGNAESERDLWLLLLRRHPRRMFGRGKPAYEEAAVLVKAIRTLLAATPSVQEMEWLYETP